MQHLGQLEESAINLASEVCRITETLCLMHICSLSNSLVFLSQTMVLSLLDFLVSLCKDVWDLVK